MDKATLQEYKKTSNELKPQFNIGKNGITKTFIESIDKYLEANKIVKIKASIAKDKAEVKELAKEVAKATNSEIIKQIGFTFVLAID